MLFDLTPKSRDEDFYNYEAERHALQDAIKRKEKIISIEGVRRVGKTSLMNIAFSGMKKDTSAWIDGRILKDPVAELGQIIVSVAEKKQANVFGRIDGIGFSAFGVGVSLNTKRPPMAFEKALGKIPHFYAFIDEAQRTKTGELANFISYCYDRCPNISFIISGSEVGLLQEVLGTEDAGHSLYGRNICRIKMERLARSRAMDFLGRGFSQAKAELPEAELSDAINELDGLIGWLTMFGYNRAIAKKQDALKETVWSAVQIASSELSAFLSNKKEQKLYKALLKKAKGVSWSELKLAVEKETRRELNPNAFSEALKRLEAHSFIEKKDEKYSLCDPIFLQALLRL